MAWCLYLATEPILLRALFFRVRTLGGVCVVFYLCDGILLGSISIVTSDSAGIICVFLV